MKKIKMIIAGAGLRGFAYTDFALSHKDMYEVVAVAEPVKERREKMQKLHNIPDNMCFEDWRPLLALPKFADLALISTMDDMHYEPCLQAIEKKYDILLEKPMAPQRVPGDSQGGGEKRRADCGVPRAAVRQVL